MSPVKLRHLHLKCGTYWYVRRAGGKVVWTKLSRDLGEAMRLWQALEGQQAPAARTVRAAIDAYLAARGKDLAPGTLKSYGAYRKALERAFSEFTVEQIKPPHIRQYLDARTHKPAANREIKLLSACLNHAKGLGWLEVNPTLGIRKHSETPRRRVFSDAELAALREHAPERLRAMIDVSLLTAMRQGDLLRLRLSDATDEGLAVQQQKTGTRLLYQWTPALQEAVGRAKRLRKRVGSVWLFSDSGGAQIKASSLQGAWARLRVKAGVADAHWHDLRATSLTWAKESAGIDYAQRLAGHASSRMTEAYVGQRATTRVRPIR
jgi:integrase